MQENEFKNILRERASGFELEPSADAFDQVMKKRNALKRSGSKHRRFFYYLSAASVVAALSAIFVWQPNPSPQGLALQNDQAEQILRRETDKNSRETDTGTPPEALAQAGPEARGEITDLSRQANDHPSQAQTGSGSPVSHMPPGNVETARLQVDEGKIRQPKKNDQAEPGRNAVKTPAFAGSITDVPEVAVSHEATANRMNPSPRDVPDNRAGIFSMEAGEPLRVNQKEAMPAPVNFNGASLNPSPVQGAPIKPIEGSSHGDNAIREEKKSIGNEQTIPAIAVKKGVADSLDPGKKIPELAQAGGVTAAPDSLQGGLQASVHKDPEMRDWVVSALVTPQVVNSAYSGNSAANDPWMKEYLANRQQNDKARFSYNAGVRVERMLGKHFSIGTGAIVSVIKFEELQIIKAVPPPVVLTQPNSNPGVGVNPTTNGGNGGGIGTGTGLLEKSFDTIAMIAQDPVEVNRNRFDISFTALEVPIMVNYHYRVKKLRVQGGVGIAFNYLLKTRSLVFEQSDSLNVKETDDASNRRLQQFSYVAIASVTAGYDLGKRFNIYAGPVFRYSLSSLYSNAYVIRQEPYFLGLELGLRYYL